LWFNWIASKSSNVWHSTQFSYAGTGFTLVFSTILCGSLYLKFRAQTHQPRKNQSIGKVNAQPTK
jgi:hypothetical protein